MVSATDTNRGRAASTIRPGILVKYVLSGLVPLVQGGKELVVHEACIADLFATYREYIQRENQLRKPEKKIGHMVYDSFCHLFKYARYLGLVEFVRQEPMLFGPEGKNLYRVDKKDNRVSAVVSKRRIYRLTALGMQDEKAWTNLRKAYGEQWLLPQSAILPAPYYPGIPIEVLLEIPVVKFREEPSAAQYKKMIEHLKKIEPLDRKREDVKLEFEKLEYTFGDWSSNTQYKMELAEEAGRRVLAERHEETLNRLNEAYEALVERDIKATIDALNELI